MPMHPDFVKIRDKFRKRYGEEEGDRFFYAWLNKHKLDDTKPYSVQAQLLTECLSGVCEAFQWAGPLIKLLREDDDAKYYKTMALTANISANRNDYTDLIELERAASTLTWRPLNINHDHSQFLPFPEARVDWAAYEDGAVEAIIRIPNTIRYIQRMIENGEIMHVSIEGEPRSGIATDEGRAPVWYNFTALALLEKDKTLPGDPLTTIEPLILRESMGRSLVESLSMGEETKEKEKTMTENIWHEYQGLEEAKWTTKYINDLPNTSFAIVETCYRDRKDARHLPYKDASGGIDLPHLRNALARMDQVKSVCGGSDEKLREAARRKLIPLAKKHLPGSKFAKEELEEMNAGTVGQCAQCKFYKEWLPKTVRTDKVLASEPSDGYVLSAEGGMGPGVGECQVAKMVVRKNDAACYDGRPRDTPTSADDDERIIEMEEEKKESIEETVLRTEINDLKADLLLTKQDVTKEIADHVETQKEVTFLQDKLARKDKELTIVTLTKQRLAQEAPVLREQIGRLKDDNTRNEVRIDGLEHDVTLYKSEAKRFEDQSDVVKRTLAEVKEDILKIRATLNDEIAKRAEAVARALSAEENSARVMKENVDLNERLVKTHRELTDSLQTRTDSAKNVVKLQIEVADLKEEDKEKTETIRELKRKLGKRPKTVTVKV